MNVTLLRNTFIGSFGMGFIAGCIPNKICVHYNDKIYNRIPLPLTTGCISILGLICSPLILTNYMFDGTYIDKTFDKYDIDIERYHQYDGNNNKYAFPSRLILHINNKE